MRPPLIVLLCATAFTSTFSIGAFPPLLPELGGVAGLADWQLGAVAGAFGLARMSADIPVGLLIRHHVRRALLLSPLLLVLGVLVLTTAETFGPLILGRVLMGVAHALGVVAGLTAILRYQTGRLASALNAFELSAMLGVLGGTVVLGLLPARLPWNLAMLFTCSPLVLGITLIPLVLAALPAAEPVVEPSSPGPPPAARQRRPLTGGVALAFAAGGAVAICYAALNEFVIPLRGSREFGLDRSGVARLLMTVQLCDVVCLLPAGFLSDRLGVSRVLGCIVLALGAGTALIAFGDLTMLWMGCVLFGVGMSGWTLPLGLLRRETAAEQVGWRTAVYRVGVDGGIFLGPFLSGLLAGSLPNLLPGVLGVALLLIGLTLVRRREAP